MKLNNSFITRTYLLVAQYILNVLHFHPLSDHQTVFHSQDSDTPYECFLTNHRNTQDIISFNNRTIDAIFLRDYPKWHNSRQGLLDVWRNLTLPIDMLTQLTCNCLPRKVLDRIAKALKCRLYRQSAYNGITKRNSNLVRIGPKWTQESQSRLTSQPSFLGLHL